MGGCGVGSEGWRGEWIKLKMKSVRFTSETQLHPKQKFAVWPTNRKLKNDMKVFVSLVERKLRPSVPPPRSRGVKSC